MIVKDTPEEMVVISRIALQKKTGKTRTIRKGEKMSGKVEVKIPDEIRMEWEEARFCAALLKKRKARIWIATNKNGSTYRYTKPR